MANKTQKRSRLPWVLGVVVVVIVLIVLYVVTTNSSNADLSRIAAKTGISDYCQSEGIQSDCLAYADSLMAQHQTQVMECHRQYMVPTHMASFQRCLVEAGVLPE